MKKLFFALAVASVFSSCSKEYDCVCTVTMTDEDGDIISSTTNTSTLRTVPFVKKKADVSSECDSQNESYTYYDDSEYKSVCVLK